MCEGDGIGDKDVCYVYISFFSGKTEWLEFVKVWEVTERVKVVLNLWLQWSHIKSSCHPLHAESL